LPPEASIRAITAEDFAPLAAMGLDQAVAMRAQAQDMGWVLGNGDEISGAATAYLADGTVFLDRLIGGQDAQLQLIDHASGLRPLELCPSADPLCTSELRCFGSPRFRRYCPRPAAGWHRCCGG
jgi:hypothetical protein